MKSALWPARKGERRATVLAGLILLQAMCALFFVGDVIEDFRVDGSGSDTHLILEAAVVLALLSGVAFLMVELRSLLARMSDMETGLSIARGQVVQVMQAFFEDWGLTNAEREVAVMILKGLDNDTIADVRNTASGTVRAQATSIYAKSATSGRAQFISLFVEELMVGEIGRDRSSDGGESIRIDPRLGEPKSQT